METRLRELLEKELLTKNEVKEVEEHEEVGWILWSGLLCYR